MGDAGSRLAGGTGRGKDGSIGKIQNTLECAAGTNRKRVMRGALPTKVYSQGDSPQLAGFFTPPTHF